MKISIIVPVFNVEDYISDCLNSLKEVGDSEIIAVNDGSTDKSLEILELFQKEIPSLQIISQENSGLSMARNAGLKAASGDYVLFCDSDDFIDVQQLNKAIEFLKKHNLDILACNGRNYEDGIIGKKLKKDSVRCQSSIVTGPEYYLTANESKEFSINVVVNLYKRSFLTSNNLLNLPGIIHEDEEFTPRAFMCAKKVCYFPSYFYIRRHRIGSITKSHRHKYLNPKSSPSFYEILKSFDSAMNKDLVDTQLKVLKHAIFKCWLEIVKRELYYIKAGAEDLSLSKAQIVAARSIVSKSNLPLKLKLKIWRYDSKLFFLKAFK